MKGFTLKIIPVVVRSIFINEPHLKLGFMSRSDDGSDTTGYGYMLKYAKNHLAPSKVNDYEQMFGLSTYHVGQNAGNSIPLLTNSIFDIDATWLLPPTLYGMYDQDLTTEDREMYEALLTEESTQQDTFLVSTDGSIITHLVYIVPTMFRK